MNLEQFTIRKATPADAEILSSLGALAFTQAFAALNTPENLAMYLAGAFSPAKQAAELALPGCAFFIVELNNKQEGYARMQGGASKPCVRAQNPVELVRFYVLEAWKGQGVAHLLMNACLAEAKTGGYDVIWLSAWKENPRALAFYRKWGFEEVGSNVFVVGEDAQEDAIMARPVE
jgi:diamine N-acetyltransferase